MAVAFLAGAAALVAAALVAGAFLAAVFLAGAAALVAAALVAGAFLAAVFLAGAAALVAGAFLAAVFFAGAAFFAGAFVAAVLAGAAFLVATPVTAAAAARTLAGGFGMVAAVSFGSFFAPATTSLSSLPAENFGTDFFLDFIRSPVCGLRTQRALRTAFSNEPKPVMATFSPLATSRVMVSRTDSSAWAACLRFPS